MKHELEADAACLERALRESWPRERAELQALLRRRPEWAALLDGPDGALDLTAVPEEQDLRLAAELLALARASPARPAARRPRRFAWGLAAAASLALIGGWWWNRGATGTRDDTQSLGAQGPGRAELEKLSCLWPVGPGSDFHTFEWTAARELAPDESYVVVVFGVDDSGAARDPLQRRETTATAWSPEPEDVAAWPDRILWRVSRTTSDGARTGSDEALASR